ncbi:MULTISPECIES: RNA polymerase sigma factor [Dyella]|uniref:Sigma-70 family RNA polymerase sigma factor n=2 Tax=Dyella TaxID=231454 RepID=A0A4R0YXP7_9GAMM|nr:MULTISPECIES: sigma-70 family RNA polymerase sigma factor [Dyella]TBR40270.1 sigma-70 family RNA polymerase sigma factor [Dyella terrae]TCI12149.1 sigma-70 family RNA polymerase sigma factor [Dyella soli]
MTCLFAHQSADRQFKAAWCAHLPALQRHARRLTRGDADQADDLLATTALKALTYMRRAPQWLEHPKSFLFVIMRHAHLDGIRSRRREEDLIDTSVDIQSERCEVDDACAPSALECTQWREKLAHIDLAVRAMPAAQRHLFVLRFLEDRSYPSIAARLGIHQDLVRKRVQLIRRRLRLALAEPMDAPRVIPTPAPFTDSRGRRYDRSNATRDDSHSTHRKGHVHV